MNTSRFLTPPATRRLLGFTLAAAGALLAGCGTGGTPWGATPTRLPEINLPNLPNVPAVLEAGTTSGALRLAERVRATLAAEPQLASAGITVDAFESGVVVLNGRPASRADADLAIRLARSVAGVSQVVDRMVLP